MPCLPQQHSRLDICWSTEGSWELLVHTSDKRGAGTDANVFATFYGEKGKSEEIALESNSDKVAKLESRKEQGRDGKMGLSSNAGRRTGWSWSCPRWGGRTRSEYGTTTAASPAPGTSTPFSALSIPVFHRRKE